MIDPKRMMASVVLALATLASLALFAGCSDDDDPLTPGIQPATFTLTIENGSEARGAAVVHTDQAPRQSGPDTGAADANANVRMVDDGFIYPPTGDVVRVTLTVE
jgi:hypothetical protein